MNVRISIVTALGVAVVLYVVTHVGWGAVVSAAVGVGWSGFAALCLYGLALFLLLGLAWYVLLSDQSPTPLWVLIWARMVRDATAEVLPISQLGGIVLGARAALVQGVATPLAFASMVVDVTTEFLAQVAYIGLGIALLYISAPRTPMAVSLSTISLIGLVLAAVAAGVLFALQVHGHRLTGKLAARLLPAAVAPLAAVTAKLDAIYRSPARVALSCALHLAAWIASAIGTWIAFRLIGVRLAVISAVAIESFVYAARTAAAFVPSALGVQEAAYVLLTPLFGVGAEFGLAVSLLKRARDIALGVPILLIWQAVESRGALAAARPD